MFCSKCGKEIDKGATFCKYCGTRVPQGPGMPNPSGGPAGGGGGKPQGSGKGGGNILLIAGIVGGICGAIVLAVVLFLFARNLLFKGDLADKLWKEDEEGKVLWGKVEKSSLPGFIQDLLEADEEEEEGEGGEDSEEGDSDSDSEALPEEDPETLFQEALSDLVSAYGVFNQDQKGIMHTHTDLWMNPRGVISATIFDFDQDDQKEMMVYYMEPASDRPGSCDMMMSMYEIEDGVAVLADRISVYPYYDDWEGTVSMSESLWSEMRFRVHILEVEGNCYIMMEDESVAAAFADGQSRDYWAMAYEDGKWNYAFSYSQTAGGSAGFAYTGYEFEKGELVNSQLYYDEESYWRDTGALYSDFNTAITEFFGKLGIGLRSNPEEYGVNESSILSDDTDKTHVFTFTNRLESSDYHSSTHVFHAVMDVDGASRVSGEPAPSNLPVSSGAGEGDYLLPEANSRYLTREEVNRLSTEQLRLARNEVYARHGRLFDSPDLQNYFNGKSWYQGQIPADRFSDSVFNDYERKNLDLIRSVEAGR